MSVCSNGVYRFVTSAVRVVFRIAHPVLEIEGREKFPEGAAVICCNHCGITDPFWVIAWSRLKRLPRTMAKKELYKWKTLAWACEKFGAFPVDRGAPDINAIKTAMQVLKSDNKLLIFPEGTRVKKGKKSEPHSGALLIAARMKAPVIPTYLSVKRGLFRKVRLIFGEPYFPEYAGPKPTGEELEQRTKEMMEKIYQMGEQA